MREVTRCDECRALTARPLTEVAVEERVAEVNTMGGSGYVYGRRVIRICESCLDKLGAEEEA